MPLRSSRRYGMEPVLCQRSPFEATHRQGANPYRRDISITFNFHFCEPRASFFLNLAKAQTPQAAQRWHSNCATWNGAKEVPNLSIRTVRRKHHMPTYEFRCEKCGKMFEQVWSLSEYDKRIKKKNKCPSCGSTKVVKTISAVQVKTSKKS